jgi:hypothetical protein
MPSGGAAETQVFRRPPTRAAARCAPSSSGLTGEPARREVLLEDGTLEIARLDPADDNTIDLSSADGRAFLASVNTFTDLACR